MTQLAQTDKPARDADAKPGAGLPAIDAVSHTALEHPDPRRWAVFGLTWLSYASYYLTRKNYSVAKGDTRIVRRAVGLLQLEASAPRFRSGPGPREKARSMAAVERLISFMSGEPKP